MAKVKSFVERNKSIYYVSILIAAHVPGIEEIIKSPILGKLLHAISIMPALFFVAGFLTTILYFFFNSTPLILFILLFRRSMGYYFGIGRYCSLLFRRKKFKHLIESVNTEILVEEADLSPGKKEIIFQKEEKRNLRIMGLLLLYSSGVPVLYSISTLLFPYMSGSQNAFYPHDVSSPYHMLFIVLQSLTLSSAVPLTPYEFLSVDLIIMLKAQLIFLRNSLAEIFEIISMDDEGNVTFKLKKSYGLKERDKYDEGVKEAHRKLKCWIMCHQRTMRWAEELKSYMKFDMAVKLSFICIYIIFTASSVPKLMVAGKLNDLFVSAGFALGTMSMFYYSTMAWDDIYYLTESMTYPALGKQWFIYPIPIQKMLRFISTYTMSRPFKMKIVVMNDNSETFMNIMKTAYSGLSFLIQAEAT